jgi:putative tryptophan/tyrosine transport system substrate-binding protein
LGPTNRRAYQGCEAADHFSLSKLRSPRRLIAYGIDQAYQFRRSAKFVDRILKGEHPSDIPIEQPTNIALLIKLRAAKELDLTVPPLLLARADEVIE